MSRITCKTPSTGRPVSFTATSLGTSWATLAEAPDFSIPDASNVYSTRDPNDAGRAIRAGEVFFLTPLFARNKSVEDCWIDVRLVMESGAVVECPGRMYVPAGDTALVPIQGRSLVKRVAGSSSGDKIQVRAQVSGALDLWATAEEKPSAEHIGVVG